MPPTPPKPSAGGALGRKIGPLTGLQWALIIGGAAGLYLLYKKRHTTAAAGSSSGATGGGTTTDAYGDVFDSAGNLVYAAPGGPYSGAPGVVSAAYPPNSSGVYGSAAPVASTGLTPWTPPTGETSTGSGFGLPGGAQTVSDMAGHLYEQLGPAAFGSTVKSGVGTYYQAAPGVFLPSSGTGVGGGPVVIDPTTGKPAQLGSNPLSLGAGTPEFIRVS